MYGGWGKPVPVKRFYIKKVTIYKNDRDKNVEQDGSALFRPTNLNFSSETVS